MSKKLDTIFRNKNGPGKHNSMGNLRTEQEIMANWQGDPIQPMVSICCITYNHEPFIEEALKGFLIQDTDFPFEILIHDDASTDRTADIIREYEARYPNLIKPIYQTVNQFSQGKIVSTANTDRAKGKYIALCEGDDYWISSDKLQSQFDIMEANQDIGMVHTDVLYIDAKNQPVIIHDSYNRFKELKVRVAQGDVFGILLLNGCGIETGSVMIKKNLIEKDPKWFFHDYWLFLDISRKSLVFFVNYKMSAYRIHQGGIMHSDPSWAKKRFEWARLDNIYKYVFRKDSNWIDSNRDFGYIECTEVLTKLLYHFCCKELIFPKLLLEILLKKPFFIFGIMYSIPMLGKRKAVSLYYRFRKLSRIPSAYRQ